MLMIYDVLRAQQPDVISKIHSTWKLGRIERRQHRYDPEDCPSFQKYNRMMRARPRRR